MSELYDLKIVLTILAGAVATYLTRISGHLLISRMTSVPPRLEAALNAVPAAVLTTLVAPAFFYGGLDMQIAMAVAFLVAFRTTGIPMLVAGWITLAIARAYLG